MPPPMVQLTDPEVEAATALVIARLLAESDVRARGRAAANRLRARWESFDEAELAEVLADAEVVREMTRPGRRRPETQVGERVRAVLAGDAVVPGDVATRAVEAAKAAARMCALAEALRRGPVGINILSGMDVISAAASAALARAAASALDERLAEQAPTIAALADELRRGLATYPQEHAAGELANRLAAASYERRRRADRLTEALLARAEPEVVPVLPPARPESEQLAWLRDFMGESLYTDTDAKDGANWLGSDPFRLRELPPEPDFLAGIDTTSVPAAYVAPLLRSIDLVRPAPEAIALNEPAEVSRSSATEIPRVLHAIWLGGVPRPDSPFLRNLGYAALRYAGEIDVVLWTDLARGAVPDHLLGWAREHDVALVNIFEVFHAGAPMLTHAQYILEMAKQLPRGYAAASDLLRLEVVHRFGGVYADGDLEYADQARDMAVHGPHPEGLVEFLDRLAASELGFTMDPLPRGGIGNDIVAGPAGHRAIRLWLEETRVNYFRSHAQIFGGLPAMALPYVGEARCAMRYVAPSRTGRVHHRVLKLLGLAGPDLPATQPPFRFNSVGSWIPTPTDAPPAQGSMDDEQVLDVLARCLTVLEWQSVAREGDLYLAAVEPVVRGLLPDPEAAWIALLTVLSTLPGVEVTSVTDVRRRDDGELDRIELPPEAQALIHRRSASESDWLGAGLSADGRTTWLVDERVEAAELRGVYQSPCSLLEVLRPLTEVAYDVVGRPIGLWIRPEDAVRRWRVLDRFRCVPHGWIGVSVGGPPGWDWREHWPLDAVTIAELLLGAGALGRPVLLSAPWGGRDFVGRLAKRLGALLGQDVEVVEGPVPLSAGRGTGGRAAAGGRGVAR